MRSKSSKDIVVIAVLIFLGSILFLPHVFDYFVVDDFAQIVNFPLVHSLKNIPRLFFGGFVFQRDYFDFFNFYWRPAMFSLYPILYFLGGGTPFAFHLFQMLVFIANAVLVYFFLAKFTKRQFAFAASVLFLAIPVNGDVARYI